MATIVEGKIGQEVRLTGNGKVNAYKCVNDSSVIIQVALDTKTARFTPTQNKTYKISITEDGKIRYIDVVVGGTSPPEPPIEPPVEPPVVEPPIPAGNVIWDSNRDGKWNNGVKRTVTDREGTIHINASGKPRLHINGDGTAILECPEDGHGRWYAFAPHYDAVLERQVIILDDSVDNDSTKIDSRHQYADEVNKNAKDEEKQGGLGNAWHRNEVNQKIEIVHGKGSACSKNGKISIKTGQPYRTRFTVKHNDAKKEIYQLSELEYPIGTGFKKVLEQTCASAPDQFFNKAQFLEWSEFWNRLNGKGKIKYDYVRLIAV